MANSYSSTSVRVGQPLFQIDTCTKQLWFTISHTKQDFSISIMYYTVNPLRISLTFINLIDLTELKNLPRLRGLSSDCRNLQHCPRKKCLAMLSISSVVYVDK